MAIRRIRRFLALAAAMALITAVARAGVQERTPADGLRVIVQEDHLVTVVVGRGEK